MPTDNSMTITEVAYELAVTPKTIARWEKSGRIKAPQRNYKGWRVYTHAEVKKMKQMMSRRYRHANG